MDAARSLTFAAPKNLGHRNRGIVVQDRLGIAVEEIKGQHTPIQKRLRRLAREGLHETGILLRQIHAQKVDFLFHPANYADGFTEIHLRMLRWVHQRHKCLAATRTAEPDMSFRTV